MEITRLLASLVGLALCAVLVPGIHRAQEGTYSRTFGGIYGDVANCRRRCSDRRRSTRQRLDRSPGGSGARGGVGFRRVGARKDAGLEDAETDAALFCVTRNGEGTPVRAFMRAGTYLKGGESASLLSQTGDHHS